MRGEFAEILREIARRERPRIGIGIRELDRSTLDGLRRSQEYARLVLVGPFEVDSSHGLEFIESEEPAEDLVDLLARGEIDGAVRGNVSAARAMNALERWMGRKVKRMAFMAASGWHFLLGPVGIAEGDSVADFLDIASGGSELLRRLGVEPAISILSGGRLEDMGRSPRVDKSLEQGELIAALAREKGMNAVHKGILIEECWGDDLILAPDGISGNLIFRTLLFLGEGQSFGAPALIDEIFVDSSRSRSEFTGPIMLAAALAGIRRRA